MIDVTVSCPSMAVERAAKNGLLVASARTVRAQLHFFMRRGDCTTE